MSSVRKVGGKWYVRFLDAQGAPREKACAAPTKQEALRLAREMEAACERVRLGLEAPPPKPTTVSSYAEEYLGRVAGQRGIKSKRSRFVNHIIPALGDRLLTQLTAGDVAKALANLTVGADQRRASPETVAHVRRDLRAMINSAKADGLLPKSADNAAALAPAPRIPKRVPVAIPVSTVAEIIAVVADQHRALFATAVMTGLRKGELAGLLVRNVDLPGRTILVTNSYDGAPKDADARVVTIPEELVPFLRVELARARSEWLFPRADGRMMSRHAKLEKILRTALKHAGCAIGYDFKCRRKGCGFLERRADSARAPCPRCGFQLWVTPVPPHYNFKDLRSTWATHALRATRDVRFVQDALGHSDAKVTERYAALLQDHKAEQSNRVRWGVRIEEEAPMKAVGNRWETGGQRQLPPGSLVANTQAGSDLTVRAMQESNLRPLAPEAKGTEISAVVSGVTECQAGTSTALDRTRIVHDVAPSGQFSPLVEGNGWAPRLASSGERLLSVREVAARLSVSAATVYRLASTGALPSVQVFNAIRVRESDLAAYISRGGAQ